jgi:hypothetical protein
MKRVTLASIAAVFIFFACQKNDAAKEPVEETATPQLTERKCAADEVLQQQMAADPALRQRMQEIEKFTSRTIASGNARLVNGVIEIPVVVHVVYRTTAENISDAQVQSQIDVLNEDFNNTNTDRTKVPDHFKGDQTNVGVRFVLAQTIRKQTKKRSWGTNDDVKRSSRDGSSPIDPANNLNMWSCNLSQSLLGYAQFPGGNPATDGVVVLYSAVGSKDKAAGTYTSNYNLGRTATHEVGHWMNLRHIWGDATCGSDLVGDTPQHNTSNGGCPSATHRSTCTGTPLEMWMNYMDYTYDACMYMFSNGQRDRMLAVFAANGPRAAFGQ